MIIATADFSGPNAEAAAYPSTWIVRGLAPSLWDVRWRMADVMRIENTSDIALPTSHI